MKNLADLITKIETGRVYTDKDLPPFKTEAQHIQAELQVEASRPNGEQKIKISRAELKELVKEVISEGRMMKLEMPRDKMSRVKVLAIMKKLNVPKGNSSSKDGYNITKKGGKEVLELPMKHIDDVIEQMIKMNVSVRSI